MIVIYFSQIAPKKGIDDAIDNNKSLLSVPACKFNRLLIKGLKDNSVEVHVPIDYKIYKKCSLITNNILESNCIEEEGICYDILPAYNNKYQKFKHLYNYIMKIKKTCSELFIICDALVPILSLTAIKASLKKNIYSIGVFTDLPQFLYEHSWWKVKFQLAYMNKFNMKVLLTDAMKHYVNKKNTPYIVIEGLVDNEDSLLLNLKNQKHKKTCLYAGALNKKYGVGYLVEAFEKINMNDVELHIYGWGEFELELKQICKNNNNIKFFGTVSNDVIIKAEQEAVLLINPRFSNEEYTKYSFPSKNMEYMLSGTPLLTTKLPGMPKDYIKYVYLIENETSDGLAEQLKFILEKDINELESVGAMAREFVLKNKNNVIQAKKIIKMIKNYRRD